jgi:hypothetical protein
MGSHIWLGSWTLNMRPIGCPETLVSNYHYTLRNSSKEHSYHLLRGRGPNHSEIQSMLSHCSIFLPQNTFLVHSQNFSRGLSASSCLSVRPSGRPHGTIRISLRRFYGISYLSFWKSAKKIKAWLNSDKNEGYCTWRRLYIDENILLNCS